MHLIYLLYLMPGMFQIYIWPIWPGSQGPLGLGPMAHLAHWAWVPGPVWPTGSESQAHLVPLGLGPRARLGPLGPYYVCWLIFHLSVCIYIFPIVPVWSPMWLSKAPQNCNLTCPLHPKRVSGQGVCRPKGQLSLIRANFRSFGPMMA